MFNGTEKKVFEIGDIDEVVSEDGKYIFVYRYLGLTEGWNNWEYIEKRELVNEQNKTL